jgi:hypothetical protein
MIKYSNKKVSLKLRRKGMEDYENYNDELENIDI